MITSGSLQAFVFLAEQLVQPGARVLFEAPTYDRPIKILRRLGAEMAGIPMDDDGLVPEALEQAAGVTFVEGKDFFADGGGGRSLRLAFSFVSTDEIAEGVARLAPLLAGKTASLA